MSYAKETLENLEKEKEYDGLLPPKENGVKKTKTPRQYDSILKGALALELKDRVELKNQLVGSIKDEVERKKKEADEADKVSQG